MEQKIINKINEAKQLLENHECKLRKYQNSTRSSWSLINSTGIRKKICSKCILGQANVDVYDINDNDVEVNICTLLDVMDYIEGVE